MDYTDLMPGPIQLGRHRLGTLEPAGNKVNQVLKINIKALIQEVVIRPGYASLQTPCPRQLIFYVGTAVWKHSAKICSRSAVLQNAPQKGDIRPHGIKSARRVKEHKSKFAHQAGLF